jgi:hypothetical protein
MHRPLLTLDWSPTEHLVHRLERFIRRHAATVSTIAAPEGSATAPMRGGAARGSAGCRCSSSQGGLWRQAADAPAPLRKAEDTTRHAGGEALPSQPLIVLAAVWGWRDLIYGEAGRVVGR